MCESKCCPGETGHAVLGIVGLAAAAVVVLAVRAVWPAIVLGAHVAVIAAAVLSVLALTVAVVRFVRASPAARRNYPLALLARLRWRWLARNCGLSYVDPHKRSKGKERIRHPRARFAPTAHGLVVKIRTTPRVGRQQLEDQSEHLANALRVQRVAVTQPRPGRLELRAMKVDPLTDPLTSDQVPIGLDLTRLFVGRDEFGSLRFLPIANTTAVTVAGIPGAGKSSAINSFLHQWAPSPAVQFSTADGKGADSFLPWEARALRTLGDDREEVADMLLDEVAEMRQRLRTVHDRLGVRNAWAVGPTEAFPLRVMVLDEVQRWLDLGSVKGDKEAEKQVMRCRSLVQEIVRLGRSVMMFVILSTQLPNVDSLPSQIRSNAGLSMAFALRTMDGAVAALGSEIRSYESFSPTTLQGPEYVGCAVTTLRTGMDGYTKVRLPGFTEAEIAERAAASAHLRRDPRATLPGAPAAELVPDTIAELVSSSRGGGPAA